MVRRFSSTRNPLAKKKDKKETTRRGPRTNDLDLVVLPPGGGVLLGNEWRYGTQNYTFPGQGAPLFRFLLATQVPPSPPGQPRRRDFVP